MNIPPVVFQGNFDSGVATDWATSGSPTVSTNAPYNGTHSGRISSLVTLTPQYFQKAYLAADSLAPVRVTFYLRVATLPSIEDTIANLQQNSGSFLIMAYINLTAAGALTLYKGDPDYAVVGSSSGVLALNTYYKITLWFDAMRGAGRNFLAMAVNDSLISSASNLSFSNGVSFAAFGGNLSSEANTAGDWYIDAVSISRRPYGGQLAGVSSNSLRPRPFAPGLAR